MLLKDKILFIKIMMKMKMGIKNQVGIGLIDKLLKQNKEKKKNRKKKKK